MGILTEVVVGLLTAVVLAAVWLAFGERVRRWLRWPASPSLRPVIAWCVGCWAAAVIALALGLVGLFRVEALVASNLALAALGAWRAMPALVRPLAIPALLSLPLSGVALAPPYFYDSWVYHLGLPWRALNDGRLSAPPDHLFDAFPQLAQLLYASPLALGALRAPAVLHLIGFMVAASAASALARRLGGDRLAGGIAAAAVFYLPIAPLVPALPAAEAWTLCGVLGSVALALGTRPGAIGGAQAGLLAGVAIASRLQGVPWAAFAAAISISRGSPRIARSAAFGGACVLGSLPWWIENMTALRPPWAPIGDHREGIETLWRDANSHLNRANDPLDLLERVGIALSHRWELLVPLLLGCALIALDRRRGRILIAIAGVAGLLVWGTTGALARFLWPSVVFLVAATVSGRGSMGRVGTGIVALTVVAPGLWADIQATRTFGLVSPFQESSAVHARLVVSDPTAGFAACEALPDDARVLIIGEPRGFLFPRSFDATSQHDRPFLTDLLTGLPPQDVTAQLNERGYSHVLFNIAEMNRLAERYPATPWRDDDGRTRFVTWTQSLGTPVVTEAPIVVYALR